MDAFYKRLVVAEIKEEIPGFKSIVFRPGHGIQYKPGQYLTFAWIINNEEVRRSYSITSTPVLNEPLSIGVKRIDNGLISRQLTDNLLPGSELFTTGAGGFFTVPEEVQFNRIMFFAAGSGIAPIYPLIKTILLQHPMKRVFLIYSSPSKERTVFYEQLEELRLRFPVRFRIEYFFSNNVRLVNARLHRDNIFRLLEIYIKPEIDQSLFYICGPESYMRLCQFTLAEAGVRPDAIRMENFISPAKKKPKADPPDKKAHKVKITFNKNEFSFIQQYPDTILVAAKKQSIHLPYSCETGKCGNCAAVCKSGHVWHSANEVLTDADLNKGLVLTCVGYAVGGDIELEI